MAIRIEHLTRVVGKGRGGRREEARARYPEGGDGTGAQCRRGCEEGTRHDLV